MIYRFVKSFVVTGLHHRVIISWPLQAVLQQQATARVLRVVTLIASLAYNQSQIQQRVAMITFLNHAATDDALIFLLRNSAILICLDDHSAVCFSPNWDCVVFANVPLNGLRSPRQVAVCDQFAPNSARNIPIPCRTCALLFVTIVSPTRRDRNCSDKRKI